MPVLKLAILYLLLENAFSPLLACKISLHNLGNIFFDLCNLQLHPSSSARATTNFRLVKEIIFSK